VSERRDAAVLYAGMGWPVFPLRPRGKQPLTDNGFHDATTDLDQVGAWWFAHPGANIGVACGHACDVLDVDGPQGRQSLARLLADLGVDPGQRLDAAAPPGWVASVSGRDGGGTHFWFAPGGPVRWAGFRPHLDWLGLRGYVIAPPSRHPSGRVYRWLAGGPPELLPPAPAGLHAAATRPVRERRPPRDPGGPPAGERPGDDFNARMSWGELLQADGARLDHCRGEVEYWTRPDKPRGVSASVGYQGADLLTVFTCNWPGLEQDVSYSKFGYWAATRHGGDHAAAARDLAARGYGHRPAVEPASYGKARSARLQQISNDGAFRDGLSSSNGDRPAPEGPEVSDQDQLAARNGQAPKKRSLLFTPASKITPRPVRWVWDTTPPGAGPAELQGRFPAGSLVLAVGRAGLGKSQFAVWTVGQLTRGVLPGYHYGTPRSVVYCATEDSWEMTIVPRLMAAGADLDRVFHVRVVDDGDPHARLTLPADTGLLEAGIGEHDVALVVLDPLLSLLDHEINDYRAREVRQALEPVVAVADRTRCLFLGLAHFTKAAGSDPLMLVSGSGAFGQLIRAGVGFARDEEADKEMFVLSQIKNNLGRENLPSLKYELQPVPIETPEGTSFVSRFRFTGEVSDRSVRDLLRGDSGEDPDAKTERDEAVEWLRDLLDDSGGQMPAKEVKAAARAAGIAERTLDRARPRAGVTTKREGFGKDAVYVWRLASAPHARHVRQYLEGGEHGAHGGEHGRASLPQGDPGTLLEPAPPDLAEWELAAREAAQREVDWVDAERAATIRGHR
jgi:hypothetical protein